MSVVVAAGIGMSLIATEHYFSAGLSSPITTRKFLKNDAQDRKEVERAVMIAFGLALATGGLMSYLLKQPWPLLASLALAAFYANEYRRALNSEGAA